ncbi:hypothetical protein ACSU1N_02390 [Thermogladius sp. 4427co]|uniref:hypothetical protein n=1 Tax=Thermogladius sp. 4427co TaxID=3450718 RepID=UPI003F78F43F
MLLLVLLSVSLPALFLYWEKTLETTPALTTLSATLPGHVGTSTSIYSATYPTGASATRFYVW